MEIITYNMEVLQAILPSFHHGKPNTPIKIKTRYQFTICVYIKQYRSLIMSKYTLFIGGILKIIMPKKLLHINNDMKNMSKSEIEKG